MINSLKIYAATSLEDAISKFQEASDKPSDLGGFVNTFISLAIPISGLCVFLLVSMAAYKLITSKGNPDKLQEAKEQITNAIIGFLFILLSVAILALLANILNINIGG